MERYGKEDSGPGVLAQGRYSGMSSRRGRRVAVLGVAALFWSLVWVEPSHAAPGTNIKISVGSDGSDLELGENERPSMSADGKVIAFSNETQDIFVRDVVAGTTTLSDIGLTGASVSGVFPSISADGQHLAFLDVSTGDVLLRDLVNATTTKVNVDLSGGDADADGGVSVVSADGRYVAFSSYASDLVTGDGNSFADVFVRDIVTGVTTRISVNTGGGDANGISSPTGISDDGRYVIFGSEASDLVPGDGNGAGDVFVRDVVVGVTTRVSVDSNGGDANGGASSGSISGSGRHVTFVSGASDVVVGDGNAQLDVFVRDLSSGVTSRVSVDSNRGDANGFSFSGDISDDGRHVAFGSAASDLVASDGNGENDVFVRDLAAGVTTRVNLNIDGTETDGDYRFGLGEIAIDAEGSRIAFDSSAPNLVIGDSSDLDVFVRDLSPVGPSPSLSIGDASISEGDGKTANANFAVRLSTPAAVPVSVAFTTVNGSAVAPSDYTAKSGRITIPAGKVSSSVSVAVASDGISEQNEIFSIELSDPAIATILRGAGVGTIANDDPAPSGGGLSIGDVLVPEGDAKTANALFTVRLSAPAAAPVSVSYTTMNGSAIAPADYTQRSGTVTIAAGKVSANVSVTIKGDLLVEADEAFTVSLSAPVNAPIVDGSATGTIVSDDG